MKIIIIILTICTLYYSNTIKNSEHYIIIKKIENIEIREYKELIYASYTPKNIKDRNNSFKNVAGYIFGDNNSKEKIAMTSPVVIKTHNKNEMAFIMPKEYNLNILPKPTNKNISIYQEPKNIKACIKYSGYSNNKVEKQKIEELKEKLKKHNIKHDNNFEVLVYNSPYQFINRKNEITVNIKYKEMNKKNTNKIYLGGGCFWCTEAIFDNVIGVTNVTSGYSGGTIKNPSYKEVSKGLTNHAEVCEISYDIEKIKLEDILKIFFLSHDPTTLNRQGNDIGKHYRSIILYNSNTEKTIITNYIDSINKTMFDNKIVTEVKQFTHYYKAEEYHQNYFAENISNPYCKLVISPKVTKARKKLKKYYKK